MDNTQTFHPGDLLPNFSRVFGAFEKMQFKKFNLTVPQSYTLLTIFDHGMITMNELSNLSRVTQTTMTRTVDILVRDGYIERIRNEEDRMVVNVKLTEKGLHTVNNIKASLRQTGDAVFSKIPANKKEQVISILFLMLNIMEELFIIAED